MTHGFDFIGGGLSANSVLGIGAVASLVGKFREPSFHPVYGPLGVLAWTECLPEMVHFFLEQLKFVAYCFGPLGKSINYTIFADKRWWLSHCRYWSVWVGFLYTVIDNPPSASGLTVVFKKGMAPSSLLSSTVNLMVGSTLLMCSGKFCLFSSF